MNKVCAIIVNRDRADLTDNLYDQLKFMDGEFSLDICVVDMGSQTKSKYTTCGYEDERFSGKCYGHNFGLRSLDKKYDYYWFLMNDLSFQDNSSLNKMLEIMERDDDLVLLSPTELDSGYPASKPQKGREYHLVSTCDYLSLLIKKKCIERNGFLNEKFKYCWGAIHEYAYKIYNQGWKLGYCDVVTMKHFGGTTYGKTKNTISREKYQVEAKKFARDYFRQKYGDDWNNEFSKFLPKEIRINTFNIHKKFWETSE